MRSLSEIKGENAIIVFGDMLEPLMGLFTSEEIKQMQQANTPLTQIASMALKSNPQKVVDLYEAAFGTRDATFLELVHFTLELLSCLPDLFTSPSQGKDEIHSGSATVNTGDGLS